MVTRYANSHFHPGDSGAALTSKDALQVLVPVARALLAAIFITAAFGHFSHATIAHAATQGVPLANVLVPIAGILALSGGLSVMLGYRTRVGAVLLVLFLVPVTLMMHRFWGLADAQAAQMQQIQFMKNVSMLGGVLLLAYFGGGPFSLDNKIPR